MKEFYLHQQTENLPCSDDGQHLFECASFVRSCALLYALHQQQPPFGTSKIGNQLQIRLRVLENAQFCAKEPVINSQILNQVVKEFVRVSYTSQDSLFENVDAGQKWAPT